MLRKVPAGKFKAECLKIMDQVNEKKQEIIITKRDVPIAKLSPITKKDVSIFEELKGTVHVHGDIMEPIDEEWDANS